MSKILKSISSKLKKASKAHASQANKIDKVLKEAPFKMKGFSGFGNSPAKLTKKQMDKPVKPKPGDYKKYSDLEKYDDDKQTGTKVDKKRLDSLVKPFDKKALKKFDNMFEPKKKKEVTIGNVTYTISDKKQSPAKGKISASCKAYAKRRFKVWPSAYASGFAVKSQKAGKC